MAPTLYAETLELLRLALQPPEQLLLAWLLQAEPGAAPTSTTDADAEEIGRVRAILDISPGAPLAAIVANRVNKLDDCRAVLNEMRRALACPEDRDLVPWARNLTASRDTLSRERDQSKEALAREISDHSNTAIELRAAQREIKELQEKLAAAVNERVAIPEPITPPPAPAATPEPEHEHHRWEEEGGKAIPEPEHQPAPPKRADLNGPVEEDKRPLPTAPPLPDATKPWKSRVSPDQLAVALLQFARGENALSVVAITQIDGKLMGQIRANYGPHITYMEELLRRGMIPEANAHLGQLHKVFLSRKEATDA